MPSLSLIVCLLWFVAGTNTYARSSYVCMAAIHSGALKLCEPSPVLTLTRCSPVRSCSALTVAATAGVLSTNPGNPPYTSLCAANKFHIVSREQPSSSVIITFVIA
jgi:hypothetical protein